MHKVAEQAQAWQNNGRDDKSRNQFSLLACFLYQGRRVLEYVHAYMQASKQANKEGDASEQCEEERKV